MRFEGLWVRYGRRAPWVLRGVTAALDPGQVAVVLGRNGVGKSTLLRAAVGLLRPGRGAVVDRPRRIGWVPERFPADQPFTVRSYVLGMASVRGIPTAVTTADLARWAKRLHLTRFLDTALPALSKGSAQKVCLIQALIGDPELLVLDEPWEGLDATTRDAIPLIITEILARGGRVLVSDHLGETARLPDARHWRLVDGALAVERGTAEEEYVVEVAVAAAEASSAVARLRADGHRVLAVRPREAADGGEPVTPGAAS